MWGRFVERVIAALKSLAVISIAILILAAIIWLSPVSGFLAAFSFALAALVFHRAPLPPIRRAADKLWLTQNTTIAVFLVAILCALTAIPLGVKQYRAEQAAIIVAEQARLQALRQSNPKQYLAELKAAHDGRWESEFKALDPTGYTTYLADVKAKQEQQRQASIQQLIAQVASAKPDDLERQLQIYSELLRLDPTNKDYKAKKDKIESTLEQRRLAEEQRRVAEEVAEKEAKKQRIANDFDSRVRYATTAEDLFLRRGMDVVVRTSGDRHTTVTFKYVLMGRPTVYQMINDASFVSLIKGLGFKTVVFTDGFDSTWQFNITENGFELPH